MRNSGNEDIQLVGTQSTRGTFLGTPARRAGSHSDFSNNRLRRPGYYVYLASAAIQDAYPAGFERSSRAAISSYLPYTCAVNYGSTQHFASK